MQPGPKRKLNSTHSHGIIIFICRHHRLFEALLWKNDLKVKMSLLEENHIALNLTQCTQRVRINTCVIQAFWENCFSYDALTPLFLQQKNTRRAPIILRNCARIKNWEHCLRFYFQCESTYCRQCGKNNNRRRWRHFFNVGYRYIWCSSYQFQSGI